MNEYVPTEIARKLKEKGFPQGNEDDITEKYYTISNSLTAAMMLANGEDVKWYCPTITQVLEWLRELLEIDILPKIVISCCDNLNRIRSYSCDIYSPRLNKPIKTEYFESYEEAILTGVEYVLDNLI